MLKAGLVDLAVLVPFADLKPRPNCQDWKHYKQLTQFFFPILAEKTNLSRKELTELDV